MAAAITMKDLGKGSSLAAKESTTVTALWKKIQADFHTFLHADDGPSDRMINICMHEHCVCLTARMHVVCMCVCVFVFPLCVLVQTVQGEKAGCGISKIISLPDGKTSHIPFEVPHVIPCKG